MKKIIFLFSVLLVAGSIISCSKNDKERWYNAPDDKISSNMESIVLCGTWNDETAWACGDHMNTAGGNWATAYEYTHTLGWKKLIAGNPKNGAIYAGSVEFSAPVNGFVTITIMLNYNLNNPYIWRFADVPENVKVQDYDIAPIGNPNPGKFEWKGNASGESFQITVPENNFYAVHVDVQWYKSCE